MRLSDRKHKDLKRHGGKREKLLNIFGPRCSACGYEGEEREIVAHHIRGNPLDHSLQILLCRSCHASLHLDGTDKKPKRPEDIREAMGSSDTLEDAAALIGLSRSVLLQRRKRHGIGRTCRSCLLEFMPTPSHRHYCCDDCASEGKKTKRTERDIAYRSKKRELDRQYYLRNRDKILARMKANQRGAVS